MSTLTGYLDSSDALLSNDKQQGSGDDDAGKKKKTAKRRKVNHACLYCRRSHMTCDEGRPCQRWYVILPWNMPGDLPWILALSGILVTYVMMNRNPRFKTSPWNLLLLSQLHHMLLVFLFLSLLNSIHLLLLDSSRTVCSTTTANLLMAHVHPTVPVSTRDVWKRILHPHVCPPYLLLYSPLPNFSETSWKPSMMVHSSVLQPQSALPSSLILPLRTTLSLLPRTLTLL